MIIRLLQWNIWYKEDINNIISDLKKINADIVCIQELWLPNGDETPVRKLQQLYPFIHYEVADKFEGMGFQCNAILSKYPLSNDFSSYVQTPSIEKDDYSKEGRIYIENKVMVNDSTLNVGTVHLSYTDRFKETPQKDIEVNRLINLISKHKNNFIFMGDLNFNRDSNYLIKLEEYLKHYETDNTWPTKPFSYNGFEEKELNWKLDYIFCTNDISVKKIEVLSTKYSDHLPILLEMDLK